MPFDWSLNPYMGCVHRCTFCYVRAFEQRADRPADDRYGTSIRVKVNVAEVLRRELARPSWRGEPIAIGAATDPYQPAEGRYRLTRACLEVLRDVASAVLDHHARPADRPRRRRARRGRRAGRRVGDVLGADARRGRVADDGARHGAARASGCARSPRSSRAGVRASVGMAPLLPGLSDRRSSSRVSSSAAREAGACGIWANLLYLRPGTREHFLACLAARLAGAPARVRASSTQAAPTCRDAAVAAGPDAGPRAGAAARRSATAGRSRCDRPVRIEQLSLLPASKIRAPCPTRSRR